MQFIPTAGTDQVVVDGAGSKTLNGGSGQDTLDINYSGVSGLSRSQRPTMRTAIRSRSPPKVVT